MLNIGYCFCRRDKIICVSRDKYLCVYYLTRHIVKYLPHFVMYFSLKSTSTSFRYFRNVTDMRIRYKSINITDGCSNKFQNVIQ